MPDKPRTTPRRKSKPKSRPSGARKVNKHKPRKISRNPIADVARRRNKPTARKRTNTRRNPGSGGRKKRK